MLHIELPSPTASATEIQQFPAFRNDRQLFLGYIPEESVPAHGKAWNEMSFKVPSNTNHSGTLNHMEGLICLENNTDRLWLQF